MLAVSSARAADAAASRRTAIAAPPNLARDVVIIPVPVAAPESAPPLWRRWWAWTAFGALVAAGVVTVLLTHHDDTAVPATALGDKRFY